SYFSDWRRLRGLLACRADGVAGCRRRIQRRLRRGGKVRLGNRDGLLGGLGERVVRGVRRGDGVLDQRHGGVRTGRRGLRGEFDHLGDLAVAIGDAHFDDLRALGGGGRSDAVQVAVVADELLERRLRKARVQRHEFLRILDAEVRLGGLARLFEQRLGGGNV